MRVRGSYFIFALPTVVIFGGSIFLLVVSHGATSVASTTSTAAKSHLVSASGEKTTPNAAEDGQFSKARRSMIEVLRHEGIKDGKVLAAMNEIQRQRFVPANRQSQSYDDCALQIGHEQTISRPYIVALMTELVKPSADKRVLDIGTGSGYQAAVLAKLCKEVDSIEIVEPLATTARKRLAALGYKNVNVRCGDGYHGWPEKGPFDIIVVAAAPDQVPQALVDQLAPGGRLVIPVGDDSQKLLLMEKDAHGIVQRREVLAVKFVPMTGEAQNNQKKHS